MSFVILFSTSFFIILASLFLIIRITQKHAYAIKLDIIKNRIQINDHDNNNQFVLDPAFFHYVQVRTRTMARSEPTENNSGFKYKYEISLVKQTNHSSFSLFITDEDKFKNLRQTLVALLEFGQWPVYGFVSMKKLFTRHRSRHRLNKLNDFIDGQRKQFFLLSPSKWITKNTTKHGSSKDPHIAQAQLFWLQIYTDSQENTYFAWQKIRYPILIRTVGAFFAFMSLLFVFQLFHVALPLFYDYIINAKAAAFGAFVFGLLAFVFLYWGFFTADKTEYISIPSYRDKSLKFYSTALPMQMGQHSIPMNKIQKVSLFINKDSVSLFFDVQGRKPIAKIRNEDIYGFTDRAKILWQLADRTLIPKHLSITDLFYLHQHLTQQIFTTKHQKK